MYGGVNENRKTQRLYQQCSTKNTLISIHHWLKETGSLPPSIINPERDRNSGTPTVVEQLIRRAKENPRLQEMRMKSHK